MEPRTRAHTMGSRVQTPAQCPDIERPPAVWAYNLLRTKYFHGVSSENQHPYLLKSRHGKVRTLLYLIACLMSPAPLINLAESRVRANTALPAAATGYAGPPLFAWPVSMTAHRLAVHTPSATARPVYRRTDL